jgi:hypothetical protein
MNCTFFFLSFIFIKAFYYIEFEIEKNEGVGKSPVFQITVLYNIIIACYAFSYTHKLLYLIRFVSFFCSFLVLEIPFFVFK